MIMEEVKKLKYSQKMTQSVNKLQVNLQTLDQVTIHCRRDHISPFSREQKKNRSCYQTSYSPPKILPNYNRPIVNHELTLFRKHQSSSLLLPGISDCSQYQKSFQGKNQDKVVPMKEKQSWFLKANWALDPLSNYKKDFNLKDATQYNKTNKLRAVHNNLSVFNLKQNPQTKTNYQREYRPFIIKKQLRLTIGDKDHIGGKENVGSFGLTEYQHRFDTLLPIRKSSSFAFLKEVIPRKSKLDRK